MTNQALTSPVGHCEEHQQFIKLGGIFHPSSNQTFITKDLLASFGKTPVFEGAGST